MRCIALALALLAITLGVFSFQLLGCSSDDKPAAAADSGGVCPAAVNDSKATFTSSSDDETCKAIADQLNAPPSSGDDAGSGGCSTEAVAYELREVGGRCEAEASASCDGAELAITCRVAASGDADCTAKLRAADIPPCDFGLTLRR
ncbi:MAG TPA: hypothetical protein VFN67_36365 [Polyangiales bacterium]|nr:hypothetical protein [Polyangiales bacterium]